jgi:TolB protein
MRVGTAIAVIVLALGSIAGCAGDPAPDPVEPTTGPDASSESTPPAAAKGPVVAFDDGAGHIFVANLDGTDIRQVGPTDGVYGMDAAISPDATRLAYAGDGIVGYDIATGETEVLHQGGGYNLAYSADGSRIAFVNGGVLNVMNADGSDARVLAPNESASVPAFAPAGDAVIYNRDGYLVEVPVRGGDARVVLRDQFWNSDPVYSPDGSTIVFSSNRGGNNGSELYSIPAGGGDITPLTDTYSVHPVFTPDGSRILYTRAIDDAGTPMRDVSGPSRPEIASMNPDGTDQRPLLTPTKPGQNPSVGAGA